MGPGGGVDLSGDEAEKSKRSPSKEILVIRRWKRNEWEGGAYAPRKAQTFNHGEVSKRIEEIKEMLRGSFFLSQKIQKDLIVVSVSVCEVHDRRPSS